MAFSVGDPVVTMAGAFTFQDAFVSGGLPLFGTVESDSGGNCIVCWANGTRTTIAADGGNSLLLIDAVSAPALALYHRRVVLDPAIQNQPANAVGQGSSEGLVIGVFSAGGNDYCVIEFTGGDVWVIQAGLVFPI